MTPEAALRAATDAMRGGFVWGACDCLMGARAAFVALHGVDPLAGFAGRYAGPASALRHVRAAGGALACCRARFAAAGLLETDAPEPGDLALVPGPAPFGAALGLWLGDGTAVKAGQGMAVIRTQPLGAWTCRRS